MSQSQDIRYYTTSTAIAIVVANMIGTGVFTSLGFQLLDITSGFALLMLWVVGGVAALCGALTYAELGAALPRNGGEYHFLGYSFHPLAGFISGWISSTVGFAAPVALAAMTFAAYLSSVFPQLPQTPLAVGLIVLLTIGHIGTRKKSAGLQGLFTLLKLLLIAAFCIGAIFIAHNPQPIQFSPGNADWQALTSGSFAISLIYVNYAYNGWNAATYLSAETKDPQRSLPRVLLIGTLLVLVAYLALNFVFLYSTPIDSLKGKVEVGFVVANALFGEQGAKATGIVMSLLLVSTVSAMTLAGPRVLQVIGEDHHLFRWLAKPNQYGIPAKAIIFQSSLALIFVLTSSFQSVLLFSGFVLALNNFFAVLGMILLRHREPALPRPYKTPLYPMTPILFLLLIGWTLIYIVLNKPEQMLYGLLLIALGAIAYFADRLTSNVSDQNAKNQNQR